MLRQGYFILVIMLNSEYKEFPLSICITFLQIRYNERIKSL